MQNYDWINDSNFVAHINRTRLTMLMAHRQTPQEHLISWFLKALTDIKIIDDINNDTNFSTLNNINSLKSEIYGIFHNSYLIDIELLDNCYTSLNKLLSILKCRESKGEKTTKRNIKSLLEPNDLRIIQPFIDRHKHSLFYHFTSAECNVWIKNNIMKKLFILVTYDKQCDTIFSLNKLTLEAFKTTQDQHEITKELIKELAKLPKSIEPTLWEKYIDTFSKEDRQDIDTIIKEKKFRLNINQTTDELIEKIQNFSLLRKLVSKSYKIFQETQKIQKSGHNTEVLQDLSEKQKEIKQPEEAKQEDKEVKRNNNNSVIWALRKKNHPNWGRRMDEMAQSKLKEEMVNVEDPNKRQRTEENAQQVNETARISFFKEFIAESRQHNLSNEAENNKNF